MPDSADLICYDCRLILPLGIFQYQSPPELRRLRDVQTGAPSDGFPVRTRALWRWLAQHVYHDVQLVGESSAPEWQRVDPETFATIGGDLAGDPTWEQYVADWPE